MMDAGGFTWKMITETFTSSYFNDETREGVLNKLNALRIGNFQKKEDPDDNEALKQSQKWTDSVEWS